MYSATSIGNFEDIAKRMSLDPTNLFEFNKANLFEDPAFPSIPLCRICQDMICGMYPADFKSGPFQEDAPTNLCGSSVDRSLKTPA